MDIMFTIITSAAVGTVISALMTAWSQREERKARREELLFKTAIEMAKTHREMIIDRAAQMGKTALPASDIHFASKFYEMLKSLLETGNLPSGYASNIDTESLYLEKKSKE